MKISLETNHKYNFISALNYDEVVSRMNDIGIKQVSLSELPRNLLNPVLNVLELENSISKISLNKIEIIETSNGAEYCFAHSRISLGRSYVTGEFKQNPPVISYEDQINKIEFERLCIQESTPKQKEQFKNKRYTCTTKSRTGELHTYETNIIDFAISTRTGAINQIKKKIEHGEVARMDYVRLFAGNMEMQIFCIILHEIGHLRMRHLTNNGKGRFYFNPKNSVSEYGRTDKKEYFAEWYAYYRLFGENDIPKDLLKIFKSIN